MSSKHIPSVTMFQCDRCGLDEKLESGGLGNLPKRWMQVDLRDRTPGATRLNKANYHICPECSEEFHEATEKFVTDFMKID